MGLEALCVLKGIRALIITLCHQIAPRWGRTCPGAELFDTQVSVLIATSFNSHCWGLGWEDSCHLCSEIISLSREVAPSFLTLYTECQICNMPLFVL